MLKRTKIALSVAAAMAATACSDNSAEIEREAQRQMAAVIEQEANKEVLDQMNRERQEIATFLSQMQAHDPAIKDAYYTNDEQTGQRVLNVVREDDNGTDAGDVMVYGLMGALAGAALASSFTNHSSYRTALHAQSGYANHRTAQQEKERKRGGIAAYVATSKTASVSRIRSNPSRLSTIKSGVMSRVASARSAGYSGGARGS